jgi:hypothetical protein
MSSSLRKRSHWRFQSEFCNPARGNEKGGVEGEGGYFRRNHWVPLPEADNLDELNTYLEQCCREDQNRLLAGHTETVGAAVLVEQAHLMPLVKPCSRLSWKSGNETPSPAGSRMLACRA